MARWFPMAFALAAGCTGGDGIGEAGTPIWDVFTFDGASTWEYLTNDPAIPYKLIVETDGVSEPRDGFNLYTMRYWKDCQAYGAEECVDGDTIFRTRWSSDASNGALIHAYSVGEDPVYIDLDPPVQIVFDSMNAGDEAITESIGATWTSTLFPNEECPVRIPANWGSCPKIEVGVSVGEGYPIAGTYWAAKGQGVTGFQLAGELEPWELSKAVECVDAGENSCADGNW